MTIRNLLQKKKKKNMYLIACIPPSPKSQITSHPSCLFGAVPQSYLKCCFPVYSPHFAPNKTLLQLSCWAFLSQHYIYKKPVYADTSIPSQHHIVHFSFSFSYLQFPSLTLRILTLLLYNIFCIFPQLRTSFCIR